MFTHRVAHRYLEILAVLVLDFEALGPVWFWTVQKGGPKGAEANGPGEGGRVLC